LLEDVLCYTRQVFSLDSLELAQEFGRAGQAKARELGVKGVLAIFKQKSSGT